MPPVTRSHSQPEAPAEPHGDEHEHEQEPDSGSDNDSDDSDNDNDEDGPLRSPMTGLLYDVDQVDEPTHELIRELFRRAAPEETPPMVVEWCAVSNDPDVYAFQLREVVCNTIRIGSPASRFPRPSCTCAGPGSDAADAARPCRHLVWLMDHIARQTLPTHPPDQPLVLGPDGCPHELARDGGAHRRIADCHIDILARTLHASLAPPRPGHPDRYRVYEAREVLAALTGRHDAAAVDAFAPDLFDQGEDHLRQVLWDDHDHEHDHDHDSDNDALRHTVLRLLLSNDEFFALLRQQLRADDCARDPFGKIQQRVALVLDALARYPPDAAVSVPWAARHVEGAVAQIRLLLLAQRARLRHRRAVRAARASACRALVWIFHALVFHHNRDLRAGPTQNDRNLYQRLIGNAGSAASFTASSSSSSPAFFLLDELMLLGDQVQFRSPIERIRQRIQTNGYREPYMRRLDQLLVLLRTSKAATDSDSDSDAQGGHRSSGTKRSWPVAGASDRATKRVRKAG